MIMYIYMSLIWKLEVKFVFGCEYIGCVRILKEFNRVYLVLSLYLSGSITNIWPWWVRIINWNYIINFSSINDIQFNFMIIWNTIFRLTRSKLSIWLSIRYVAMVILQFQSTSDVIDFFNSSEEKKESLWLVDLIHIRF